MLSCPKEQGYCLSSNGWDQNAGVQRLDSLNEGTRKRQNECLRSCKTIPGITGCELVWGQRNSGCYAHTRDVASGSGVARHICWIMSKCEDNRVRTNIQGTCYIVGVIDITKATKNL